jgi:hypothetical protein
MILRKEGDSTLLFDAPRCSTENLSFRSRTCRPFPLVLIRAELRWRRVSSIGGMMLTGGKLKIFEKKLYNFTSLHTKNFTRTGPWCHLYVRGEKPTNNHRCHGTKFEDLNWYYLRRFRLGTVLPLKIWISLNVVRQVMAVCCRNR